MMSKGVAKGARGHTSVVLGDFIDAFALLKPNNIYTEVTFDLSVPRVDVQFTIPFTANTMTIMDVPSPFSIKLNSTSNPAITAVKATTLTNQEITSVFISNSAGSGTGRLFFGGRT